MSLRRRSCWNWRLGRGRTSLEDAPIRTRSRLSTSAASSTLRLASTHGSISIWTSIWSRASLHLPTVIAETVRRRYQGRVSVGHVTKLSATPPEELDALTVGLSEAGVAVTALPATDLYLNGREYRHLIPRGVAPVHRLAAQGVVATIATNNVMNPFTPFGDASLMRMANLYANVAQIGSPAELGEVLRHDHGYGAEANGQGTRRRESWGAGGHRDLRRKLRRRRGGNHRSCDRGLEERSTDFLSAGAAAFFSHRFICGQLIGAGQLLLATPRGGSVSTPKSTRAGCPSTRAPRGVVATPHFLASSAGLNALQRGGGAVDAAIAANAV